MANTSAMSPVKGQGDGGAAEGEGGVPGGGSPLLRAAAPKHTFQSTVSLMRNPQGPPLDYSFLEIKVIEELREVMPRTGFRKQPPETIEDETGAQVPNPLRDEWVAPPRDDLQVHGLKLGNNMLASLPPVFNIIIREIMDKPRNLSWIDLSFNQLEEVPQVLASYQMLNVVYLHSNRIRKLNSAKCLTELPSLRSLTLHGNPCEQTKNYRLFCMGMFKTIKSLDFTCVTTIDREKAETFYSRYLRNKERIRNGD
uniref:Leucine-rich repeat-containing protein 51 n=2 Tax=Hemiselmis andersenii TaxID=464988 RepID=A0A7S1DYU1_HEMAN